MDEKRRLQLKQLKVIIVVWMTMGLLMSVYDHLVLSMNQAAIVNSFLPSAIRNVAAGLIGGLLGGSLLVFYVNEKLQQRRYVYTVLVLFVSFVAIVAIISFLMAIVILPLRDGIDLNTREGNEAIRRFMKEPARLKAFLAWFIVVIVTQLLLQINSRLGHGDFVNVINGRYNTPRHEEKVFMFLDINSSTSIAEKLGDDLYHALLRDFFADLSIPVMQNKGRIYQYVGDEVVITWSYNDGLKDEHCVKCFFDIKNQLQNTASRMLNKCAEYEQEVIVSSELLSLLETSKHFISKPLGRISLRGKSRELELNSLAYAM
jgi:adenylate cyclase